MEFKKNKIEGIEEELQVEDFEQEDFEEEEFEKVEKIQTRKQFRRKQKFNRIKKKIKRTARILFIGFMAGLIYSNVFIYKNVKANILEESCKPEITEVKEEKPKTSQESISEEVIENTCYLDEVSCKIKEVADKYEIDWKMAVAISKHETGQYTSYAFKTLNNVGGLMYWDGKKSSLQSFNSLEKGIEKYISNLKYNYYDMGLDTIEEIQKKYAPIGAANDPNGLNNYWVSGVTKYYYSLEK